MFQNYAGGVLSRPDAVATPRKLWRDFFLNAFSAGRDLTNAAAIVLDEAPENAVMGLFVLLDDLANPSRFGC